MLVIFSHGKESGPWGSKIQRLAAAARSLRWDVESLDYTGMDDPDARVPLLANRLAHEIKPVVLVGSSMGGYVSTVVAMNRPVSGLFLLAPALFMPGYAVQDYAPLSCPIAVVHGWRDDVIPWNHSVRFAERHRAKLHLLDGDHRLNDCLDPIEQYWRQFLKALA
jgi:pimeloyl-ACP methyl ester carboxylesterase